MSPKKETLERLEKRMQNLGILEEDLVEKFILGSGSGGQKINKTHSCVYLHHLPTGIEIKCQKERSRELNRYYARMKLCDKIEKEILGKKLKEDREKEKIRRQKKRRSRRQKQKMVAEKRKLSEKKSLRKSPRADTE